ncbi:hypothetical protein J5U23_01754 [Saccharolobus shibatae B12]|uniref:Uncharacterized protein n=2 Tax=Saccharolobus shibatae TaxID=2286 RepID=A0A8F5BPD2_SACSH|nr:hypothetical protein [Saccharolobus shibatae]QXJ28885.1 hypothetical protein J5U23_01754 [Saccharolobus shibatae B12]QXJ35201.1 hypothetical protein J5U22_01748 [Saccharolobus shibatae]
MAVREPSLEGIHYRMSQDPVKESRKTMVVAPPSVPLSINQAEKLY